MSPLFPAPHPHPHSSQEDEACASSSPPPADFFMKQTVGNACGTIALLHIAGNCGQQIARGEGGVLCVFVGGRGDRAGRAGGMGVANFLRASVLLDTTHLCSPLPLLILPFTLCFSPCSPPSHLLLAPGSFLEQFFSATGEMSPSERGKYLEEPPAGAMSIEDAHKVGVR